MSRFWDRLRGKVTSSEPRTWTRAKDVALIADSTWGERVERSWAREGIQTRRFDGLGGRAIEMLTTFVPSVIVVRTAPPDAIVALRALEGVPALSGIPRVVAGELGAKLEEGRGAPLEVDRDIDPEHLARLVVGLAPELGVS